LEEVLEAQRVFRAEVQVRPRDIHEALDEILTLLHGRQPSAPPSAVGEYPADPVEVLRNRVSSLTSAVKSMEAYEQSGGGASSELWWDDYVDRRRKARDEFAKALALAEQAARINLE
jgi:hypothetical protein